VYTPVANPTGNPSTSGYYEIDEIKEAVGNYVSSHLSLTDAGLWILKDNNSHRVLLASDGMKVYDHTGNVKAAFGAFSSMIGDEDGYNTHIGSNNVALRNGQNNIFKVDTGSLVTRFLGTNEDIFKVSYVTERDVKHICSSILFDGENTVVLTDIPPAATQITIDIYCLFTGFESNPKLFSKTVTTPSRSGMAVSISQNYGWEPASGSYGEQLPAGSMRVSGQYGYQSDTMPLELSFTGVTLSSAIAYISWGADVDKDELTLVFGNRADNSSSGLFSSSFGKELVAAGKYSLAEGYGALANGDQAHAEGFGTKALGKNSHAQNNSTVASSDDQTALGKYNEIDNNNKYAAIIGNGTADDARSNACAVTWGGDIIMGLDDYQTSGSADKALYDAIVALGWQDVLES